MMCNVHYNMKIGYLNGVELSNGIKIQTNFQVVKVLSGWLKIKVMLSKRLCSVTLRIAIIIVPETSVNVQILFHAIHREEKKAFM